MGSGASCTSTNSCAVSNSATDESIGIPCATDPTQRRSSLAEPKVGALTIRIRKCTTRQIHDALAEQPRRQIGRRSSLLPHLLPQHGEFPLAIALRRCRFSKTLHNKSINPSLTACTTTRCLELFDLLPLLYDTLRPPNEDLARAPGVETHRCMELEVLAAPRTTFI